jgi:hypothetical protein
MDRTPTRPVILLKAIRTGDGFYPRGSVQLAWADRHGFTWLRGIHTGWEISNVARAGRDFGEVTWPDPVALFQVYVNSELR